MDCSHARLLILFQKPGSGEIAQAESEALHAHLEQCRDCRNLGQRQQTVDNVLGQAMRQVPVPGDLQDRIFQRLQRTGRPNPWPWLAGAAVLLLAVGLGGLLWVRPLATNFDPADLEARHQHGAKADVVKEWFQQRGVRFALPPLTNMEYLDSWDLATVEGRRVARLLFVRTDSAQNNAVAHLYVIPETVFRFDKNGEFYRNAINNSGQYDLSEKDGFVFLWVITHGPRGAFEISNRN